MTGVQTCALPILLGLFQGIPGARQWRRYLSENAHKAGADINVLEQALKLVADKR